MQEYYTSLDEAFTAGYEAGRLNKEIHESRAWIAKHVGE